MASDFIPGIKFTDQPEGGVTAKKLNIAWRDGKISTDFVASKPAVSSVGTGDYLLLLKADGTYAKVPATAIGSGGGGGSTVSVVWGETPTGLVNGSNKVFTTAYAYQPSNLGVFLNGVRQKNPGDYSETTSTSFTFVNAPVTGDIVSVDYFR